MVIENELKIVSPSEANEIINKTNNIVILDVRTEMEHNYEGMIENSISMDFLKPRVFKREISKLDKNTPYLLYCSIGKLSVKAGEYMKEEGFKEIYVLDGGLKAWNKNFGDSNKVSKFDREEALERRKRLIIRLNRIEGQIKGMKKMLAKGEYCGDILNQSLAVKAAMGSVNQEIMEVFLNTCMISHKEKEDFFRYMRKLIK